MNDIDVLVHYRGGGRWLVDVRGELDLSTVPRLEAAFIRLERHAVRSVAVDLSGTEFMDSSGLRSLVRESHRCRVRDASFSITGISPAARRVLEIAGMIEALVGRLPEAPPAPAAPAAS